MTTLTGIKGEGFVIIGCDSQMTEGSLRVPFPYSKISKVGENVLAAGCGSVGSLQQILKIAKRQILTDKVQGNAEDIIINYDDLKNRLAELNFYLPLEYKTYSSFAFLIAGLDGKAEPSLSSVSSCGALIEVPSFYSDGSGSGYAMGVLAKGYNPDMKKEEAIKLTFEALASATKLDVYTDNCFRVCCLSVKENQWEINEYTCLAEIDKKL